MRSLDSSDASWVPVAVGIALVAAGVVTLIIGARRLLRLRRAGTIRALSRSNDTPPKRRRELDMLFRRRRAGDPPPDPAVLRDLASLLRAVTFVLAGFTLSELGQLFLSRALLHDPSYLVHAVLTPLLVIYVIAGWLLARRADRLARPS